jgi:maleamate amidohydrolase
VTAASHGADAGTDPTSTDPTSTDPTSTDPTGDEADTDPTGDGAVTDPTGAASTVAVYNRHGLGRSAQPGTRPALVVVDLVLGFTDPASSLACGADGAVATTSVLLGRFRAAHWPVVFTTVVYDTAGAAAAAQFIDKVPALRVLTPDSRWVRVDPRLDPGPGEPVVSKLFASAFFGTNLSTILAVADADTVVVTGASTSGCVRATAVDAMQYGYRVVVSEEGVADRAAGAHAASLADLQAKYAEVLPTPALLSWLDSCPARPAPPG